MDYSERSGSDEVFEGRALVAAFSDRERARDAAQGLHQEGFRKTWIGVTGPWAPESMNEAGTATGSTGTRVTEDSPSVGERIARFFSGEPRGRTLYDELMRHGVSQRAASRIDRSLEPNSAILTVDGSNHPELAAAIIEQAGGHVLAGESFAGPAGAASGAATAAAATTGSKVLGYGDPAAYARGENIDEQRRLQLREERLNIDKEQRSSGEAQIRKEIVEHKQDIDVPVIREELFVERVGIGDTTRAADTDEIAEGEMIRVPLMREQVVVTKRPVVTGEVVIGKRQVTETQRVSETTREEQLKVNDPTSSGGSSAEVPPKP